MSTSPFHGIFSALEKGRQDDEDLFADEREPEDDVVPAKAQPHAKSGVGRVAVDIYEHEDYYIIKAPIAGVRMSDLDIEINENVVVIRGNRRQGESVNQDQYYLQECFWGPFSRSITLPFSVDPRKVRATFNKDCILKILIPKEDKIKIVRIQEG